MVVGEAAVEVVAPPALAAHLAMRPATHPVAPRMQREVPAAAKLRKPVVAARRPRRRARLAAAVLLEAAGVLEVLLAVAAELRAGSPAVRPPCLSPKDLRRIPMRFLR